MLSCTIRLAETKTHKWATLTAHFLATNLSESSDAFIEWNQKRSIVSSSDHLAGQFEQWAYSGWVARHSWCASGPCRGGDPLLGGPSRHTWAWAWLLGGPALYGLKSPSATTTRIQR